ncbi:MAG TPA: helix-turn-helix transcriptional regulator [Puia sp.]|uniref:helix-turn-helix domain-containing protein n=1 Tax=Puia sp. TaxID=2045100 RepID=UPI002C0B3681|nr:helix-turn-helix transcriptional regulator [Puia sp.]HVU98406.1 helix-turn-helix transcriptional regulator [Puia sp.]
MILQEFLPPPVLADVVSSITVLQVDRLLGEWDVPLVAKAMPSIVYQSSGPGTRLLLYGQNVAPMVVKAEGHLTLVAWFLKPHGLGPLFGIRADEATDLGVDLDHLPLVREMGLRERLDGAVTANERVRLMEAFLIRLCAVAREGNRIAGYAAQLIAGGNGMLAMRWLQEELRMTERSLQRLFAEHVGLSPKGYSRVCQFQAAFRQLSIGNFLRLSDVAYDNGYADQSHLIRAFREFTGLTPTEYIERTAAFLAGVALEPGGTR